MPTEALNGRIVLTAFTNEGGVPVNPQPDALDYTTHNGVIIKTPDGTQKPWYPPVVVVETPAEAPLSRLEFRRLFTFAERMAIDNAVQGAMTDLEFATFRTLMKDFDAAQDIHLSHLDVIMGVGVLEEMGFIAAGRAEEILTS